MSEVSLVLSKREQAHQTAEALDYYVAPYCGDIYLTVLDLFPSFKTLKDTKFYPSNNLDIITSGEDEDGPGVWIGLHENTMKPSLKMRAFERFGLSEEYFDAPDTVFYPIALAHELAHILQKDPEFIKFFGPINDERIEVADDYAGYVNSDAELNADYIATVVLGNSSFGVDTGFMPPVEFPREWRQWGALQDIPRTIAMNTDKNSVS